MPRNIWLNPFSSRFIGDTVANRPTPVSRLIWIALNDHGHFLYTGLTYQLKFLWNKTKFYIESELFEEIDNIKMYMLWKVT